MLIGIIDFDYVSTTRPGQDLKNDNILINPTSSSSVNIGTGVPLSIPEEGDELLALEGMGNEGDGIGISDGTSRPNTSEKNGGTLSRPVSRGQVNIMDKIQSELHCLASPYCALSCSSLLQLLQFLYNHIPDVLLCTCTYKLHVVI